MFSPQLVASCRWELLCWRHFISNYLSFCSAVLEWLILIAWMTSAGHLWDLSDPQNQRDPGCYPGSDARQNIMTSIAGVRNNIWQVDDQKQSLHVEPIKPQFYSSVASQAKYGSWRMFSCILPLNICTLPSSPFFHGKDFLSSLLSYSESIGPSCFNIRRLHLVSSMRRKKTWVID